MEPDPEEPHESKHPRIIFGEFKDQDAEKYIGRGDVKHHLGHQLSFVTDSGKRIHLDLSFNPSHLEFVGPVAQGALRARQIRHNDFGGENGLMILIHGDAAIASPADGSLSISRNGRLKLNTAPL